MLMLHEPIKNRNAIHPLRFTEPFQKPRIFIRHRKFRNRMICIKRQPTIRKLLISRKILNGFTGSDAEEDTEYGGVITQDLLGVDGWVVWLEDLGKDGVKVVIIARC